MGPYGCLINSVNSIPRSLWLSSNAEMSQSTQIGSFGTTSPDANENVKTIPPGPATKYKKDAKKVSPQVQFVSQIWIL